MTTNNTDLDRLLREVFALCEATEDEPLPEPRNEHQAGFERGRRFEAKQIRKAIGAWFQDTFCGASHMGEPVVPDNVLHGAVCSVQEARGFVAFGAGVYRVCQTKEPGLVVTFRRPGEESRAVGERNEAPDLTPIPPEEIIVRLQFMSPDGLDSLESHLREIRAEHWPEPVTSA